MSLLNPASARIRDIQKSAPATVRIVLDQEAKSPAVSTTPMSAALLLAGARQADPGVRFYSVSVSHGTQESRAAPGQRPPRRAVLIPCVTILILPSVWRRLRSSPFPADPAVLETLKFVLEHDNNPIVRSKAVNLLVPVDSDVTVTPAMAQVIADVMRSAPEDDYVHARCSQALREAKLPLIY